MNGFAPVRRACYSDHTVLRAHGPDVERTTAALGSRESARSLVAGRVAGLAMAFLAAACDDPASLPDPDPEGRVIIASVDDPAPRGVVDAFDVVGGERTRLWDTGPETSAWRMAPDGLSVAYLAAVREPTEIERLVVRTLEVGAPERPVYAAEAAAARLAGFAWSADGRSIAAIRQIGFPGSAPASDARWELVRFDVPDGAAGSAVPDEAGGHVIWNVHSSAVEGIAFALGAWDSAAERAAVIESGLDGGPAVALRLIDTRHGRELERRAIDPGGEAFRSASDGRRLAWTRVGDGAVLVLDLGDEPAAGASGWAELREAPAGPGALRDGLVWSADGGRLAWREEGPLEAASGGEGGARSGTGTGTGAESEASSSAEARAVVWVIEDEGEGEGEGESKGEDERHVHALPATASGPGRALRPLAFSADSRWLLVAVGEPGEIEATELYVVEATGTSPPASLGWRAPAGRWGVAWVH